MKSESLRLGLMVCKAPQEIPICSWVGKPRPLGLSTHTVVLWPAALALLGARQKCRIQAHPRPTNQTLVLTKPPGDLHALSSLRSLSLECTCYLLMEVPVGERKMPFQNATEWRKVYFKFTFTIDYRFEHWVVIRLLFTPHLCFASHKRKGITALGLASQHWNISHSFRVASLIAFISSSFTSIVPQSVRPGLFGLTYHISPNAALFIYLFTLLFENAC